MPSSIRPLHQLLANIFSRTCALSVLSAAGSFQTFATPIFQRHLFDSLGDLADLFFWLHGAQHDQEVDYTLTSLDDGKVFYQTFSSSQSAHILERRMYSQTLATADNKISRDMENYEGTPIAEDITRSL
ncbi:unnamed protein product [Prorocentrum cordatum]|uniref:Uncharacterized protein n=1 Tax=Prorocentrum cordatum TaxID=2364126 RepID=A0ABN9X5L1_9DINO|nr:unnamed protein product [Polarella glacialis]